MALASALPVTRMSRSKVSWSGPSASIRTQVCWRRCSILASSRALLCCRSGIRRSGVVAVS